MKLFRAILITVLIASPALHAQSKAASAPRYFQITMDLKFGANGEQPATTQTITTQVAVRDAIPGSCKARMLSQVPTTTDAGTKYIELGTKLDCNSVHVEGNGLTLQFALETSRISEMIKTKRADGSELEEPLITNRNVELTVKLPLDQPKVVFDSNSKLLKPLGKPEPLSPNSVALAPQSSLPRQDPPLLIEMTASELK